MNLSVLDPTKDAAEWEGVVTQLPANLRDIHFTPEYAAAQTYLGIMPRLAVYRWDRYVVMQPFAVRPIKVDGVGGVDICNLYGYGGPLSNHGVTLYEWFLVAFNEWCKAGGIVSEFCALHPMMAPHQRNLLKRSHLAITPRKPVVAIDLSPATAIALAGTYKSRRQQGMKAAQKYGVAVTVEHDAVPFVRLYRATMCRARAAARWDFTDQYLHALCEFGTVFYARINGAVESAGLMLHQAGHEVAYYHLAGNAMLHPKSGANDLVVHTMALHARQAGAKWLHLGGGPTSDSDDQVLHFKAGFSDLRFSAASYFRVLDEARYLDLCVAKKTEEVAETGAEFETDFLPLYRREET